MRSRPSLQRRLVVLVAASIAIATAVSTAIGLWQQATSYIDSRKAALIATAEVFAAASGQATAAGDRDGASASMRGMGRVPDIHYAEIRMPDRRMLASFGAVARLADDLSISPQDDVSAWQMLRSGSIEVSVPIADGGVVVGTLILVGGMSDLPGRLGATAAFAALGGAVALIVGLFVAWRFQRRITEPLQALLRTMTRVHEEQSYSIVANEADDHEIGTLVDGFNHMLSGINERDQQLEAHARNLEGEVSARTADLRVARDAAEAANRAKSDFLATMSHEIRTPMNGIMVMADLLTQADLPRRQRRFADVIARSGRSLLAIINDILDFSKIEAGKLELECLPVDVNELVESVTSLFAERAREKGLDLCAFVDPSVPRSINSDPVRLGQVISNLVNNALKFTERGHVQITVMADRDSSALKIAVSDTGIGIAQDKLGAVFESFSQADSSTTRNFGGTGLGLTISQRLAHALGGEIVVESVLGQGSSFEISLPVELTSPGQDWPQLAADRFDMATCLLDVEGEATRATLTAYFTTAGLQIVTSDDRTAAVLCVDVDKVDQYVSHRHKDRPLIVVSAQGDSRVDDLLSAGKADAALTRPILRSEVEDLIQRIRSGAGAVAITAAARVNSAPIRFKPFRALVADDNAVNREVAVEALAQLNATVVTVEDGQEAITATLDGDFDIVFMDGSMPVMDGFEAARQIRATQTDASRRLPIVALTAHVVGVVAEEWRHAGMDAVVHKPFTISSLAQTIERLLPAFVGDPSQPPLSEESAPQAPASDEPTLSTAAHINTPPQAEGSAGDLLDSKVLEQLRHLQANGQGGFVRKIFGLYLDHAPDAVTQIREAASQANIGECARVAHSLKSMSYNVGARRMASLAAAIETSAKMHSRTPEESLLAELDLALAKTLDFITGQPEFAAGGMAKAIKPQAQKSEPLSEALERAAERNELSAHYQPIVDRTGSTIAVEALLRWTRDGAPISPAEFIPLAERSGSIHQIGEWVLRQACIDACAWPGVTLSVNVSPQQFKDAHLAQRIERIVQETGFDYRRLQLEITESALLNAEDAVLSVVERLRAKGVAIALDDFGTGYSSLNYLRRFPFDKIKIDKSFIDDLALTVNATIVHAIISIGRSIGLKVVAEGVEEVHQHKFLVAAGVHQFQGYLFGRPVAATAISDRLTTEAKQAAVPA